MRKYDFIYIVILVVSFHSTFTWAGKLDDFEKDATKERPNQERHKDSSNDDVDIIGELLGDIFFRGLYDGGRASFWRAECSHKEEGIVCRQNGEPLLPILKADICYQWLQSNISAIDGRAEVGYGPFGFSYRGTRFREIERNAEEENSTDTMNLQEFHALYRISGTNKLEVDLGLGMLTLEGNETNSGFCFTMPIKIHPRNWLGIHIVPTVSSIRGNAIYDMDCSVLLTKGFISLRSGYRWLSTEHEMLKGPYSGFSVHF